MSQRNPYEVLGLGESASEEEIRSAYLRRVKVLHPDRFDKDKQSNEWQIANEMLQELNTAYNQLRESLGNNAISSGLKRPTETESRVPYEILNPKVGVLYSVFCRNYPSTNGKLYRSTTDPQECELFKTSGGFFALKYTTGFLIKSGHMVVFDRDTKEMGRLPDSFTQSAWKSYLTQRGKADYWSGGILAIREINAIRRAMTSWTGLGGFYLHFTNDEGSIGQAVLLGDSRLIDEVIVSFTQK